MKRSEKSTLLVMTLTAILTSCAMQKNTPYFQGLETSKDEMSVIQNEAVIHNDDVLTITVSALDPTAVAPFNLPIVSYASPGSEQIYSTPAMQPYLVDVNGEITFPILGQIKVGGLKKSEAAKLIKSLLEPYLKDPIVIIQFMNYKVTVLGAVNRPGSYKIPNERISMLEALGMAGDLTIYGRRDNVLLIREVAGGQKEYVRIDLTQTDILSSPYFYLQQNDVIYVQPNKTSVTKASSANIGIYLSTISTLATTATVIISILNMK